MKNNLLNTSKNFLSKLLLSKKKRVYESLEEIPIAKWWSVCDGELTKLIIDGGFTQLELYNIYIKLLQDYYDAFGTTEQHKAFVNARYEYACKLAEYIEKQDGTSKMFLLIAKQDLKEVTPTTNKGKELSLMEIIVNLEKSLGFSLDKNTLSTYKFYSYLKNNG